MEYGAQHLMWAPFAADNAESADALPKYGASISLGELVKVSDSPSFAEAKAAGDNKAAARYIKRFTQCTVQAEVLELANATASAIFGATLEGTDGKRNLHLNVRDSAPYGGMAFYTVNLLEDDTIGYQGVYYPKLKASMQGKEYNTTGDSITLSSGKVDFLATACANGDWKVLSEMYKTEAEAKDWVESMVKASV